MEIVSVFNDKGGVGKTSLALEMAAGLAIVGKTILLIDNDPQGTLSRCCVENSFELEGMDKVYSGATEQDGGLNEVIYETFLDKMYIAPSGSSLKDYYIKVDMAISRRVIGMIDLIRGDLADIIDVVIIDNPPTQTGVSLECTLNADCIVVPSRPDDVCFDALIRTYSFLERQAQDFYEKRVVIFPSLTENRKMHRDFTDAMRKKYEGLNGNTRVGIAISNRSEVPTTIMEKKILYISHAASETAQQHKQMCLDVFPWLEKDSFFMSMDDAAEKKKVEVRQKFKDMARARMMKIREKTKTPEKKESKPKRKKSTRAKANAAK